MLHYLCFCCMFFSGRAESESDQWLPWDPTLSFPDVGSGRLLCSFMSRLAAMKSNHQQCSHYFSVITSRNHPEAPGGKNYIYFQLKSDLTSHKHCCLSLLKKLGLRETWPLPSNLRWVKAGLNFWIFTRGIAAGGSLFHCQYSCGRQTIGLVAMTIFSVSGWVCCFPDGF